MLRMKRTGRDRVHSPDCSYLPPFAHEWRWPDQQGYTSYQDVVDDLARMRAADPANSIVLACSRCLPQPTVPC